MLYKLRGYQLRKSKANIVAKNDKYRAKCMKIGGET